MTKRSARDLIAIAADARDRDAVAVRLLKARFGLNDQQIELAIIAKRTRAPLPKLAEAVTRAALATRALKLAPAPRRNALTTPRKGQIF